MITKGTLVVIGGPTASGKTHAAATLGEHFGTEVISADSRQFYGAMQIGTARPLEEELLGVKHHFLGHLLVEDTWSAGTFARAAEPVLQRVLAERGIVILVGGSGLYIDALIKGLDPLPAGDPRPGAGSCGAGKFGCGPACGASGVAGDRGGWLTGKRC